MRFLLGFLFLALASDLQAQDSLLNPYKLGTPGTAPAAGPSSNRDSSVLNPYKLGTPVSPPPGASAPPAVSSSGPSLSPASSTAFTNHVFGTQPPPSRAWLRAEAFLGIVRKPELPPLIRALPAAQTRQAQMTGMMNTGPDGGSVLYPTEEGNRRIDYNAFTGLRFEAGVWLNDESTRGIEFVGFGLERRNQTSLFTNPPGSPNFLSRFFIDANSSTLFSLFADNLNGTAFASAQTKIEPIYNLELNYVTEGYAYLADRTEYLYGFRYFDMRESLRADFGQNLNDGSGGGFSVTDRFTTSNQFYGLNLGVRSRFFARHRFGAETTFKLAAGNSRQRAIISGNTVINIPGVLNLNVPEGILARASNSGVRERDFVTFIPEMNLRLNYAITPRAKVYAGYDLTYVSAVVRPGSIIDPVVSSNNLQILDPQSRVMGPITNRPAFGFSADDLLIHAFSCGMAVDF